MTRIYAIAGDGHIKFGISTSPKRRLVALNIAVPYKLRLLSQSAPMDRQVAAGLESAIHAALKKYRVRGEWFASAPKTLAVVELLKCKSPIELFELFSAWASERAAYDAKAARGQPAPTVYL